MSGGIRVQNGHGGHIASNNTDETAFDVRGKSCYGYVPARTGFRTGGKEEM